MNKFLFLFVIFILWSLPSWSGTAVGNFNFIVEPQFDFRLGYPPNWKWEKEKALSQNPNPSVLWQIDNSTLVPNPIQQSSLVLRFIKNFPAQNDVELLNEIKKLHPTYQWNKLQNPDFVVGYVSDQIYSDQQSTLSYEYYFSEKNKVIQVEVKRNKANQGATEIDTILSTIRRESHGPRVISVSPTPETPARVKVGDTACYNIGVDILSTNYSQNNLQEVEVRGVLPHWSFKRITWNQKETSYRACFKVSPRFGSDGLILKGLRIETLAAGTSCRDTSKNEKNELTCSSSHEITVIHYKAPIVENSAPKDKPPQIQKISLSENQMGLKFQVATELQLRIGEIVLDWTSPTSVKRASFVLYEDMLVGKDFEIQLDPERLPKGFTRVYSIMLIDEVGNTTLLRADPGQSFYTLLTSHQNPQTSQFRVLSVAGRAQ